MANPVRMATRQRAALDRIKDKLGIERWNRDPRVQFVLELEQIADALDAGSGAMRPTDMVVSGLRGAETEELVEALGLSESSVKKLQAKVNAKE